MFEIIVACRAADKEDTRLLNLLLQNVELLFGAAHSAVLSEFCGQLRTDLLQFLAGGGTVESLCRLVDGAAEVVSGAVIAMATNTVCCTVSWGVVDRPPLICGGGGGGGMSSCGGSSAC